ncbi:MAG: MetQ/NlpA family ABC transporter substrate-binding protein [Amnibacterium sp.]
MSTPAAQDSAPQLPQKPRRTGRLVGWIVVAAVVVVAIVVGVVIATRPGSSAAAAGAGKPTTVTIGVADESESHWRVFSGLAKQKLNVDVKLVNFSDYSRPNPALSQGQTDLNEFQHLQFLASYNVTNHDSLQPVGATAVYPLPLYATKYRSTSALPKGAKVAIPNDAINEARALLVLQDAGLVTLKNGGTAYSSAKDVTAAKVTVTPLDASQTAGALQNGSVAAAIVNDNYAAAAKLPASDIITKDDPSSAAAAPYVNAFVARKADAAKPLYLKLAALYHDPSVEAAVTKDEGGAAVFRTTSAKALQAELAKLQAEDQAANG